MKMLRNSYFSMDWTIKFNDSCFSCL